MPAARPVTSDTLRQATPDLVAFLRAWEATVPGQSVTEAIETLTALGAVPGGVGLDLLAHRMNTPGVDNGVPATSVPRW